MARDAIAHIRVRRIRTKGREYSQTYIFIPKLVATDTAFPFKEDDKVKVLIDVDRKRLIVEKSRSQCHPAQSRAQSIDGLLVSPCCPGRH